MSLPHLIDAVGAPRERGRSIGEQLRGPIARHVDAWFDALAIGGVGDPRAYVGEMLARTGFMADALRAAPELMEEVEGMAEGAGVDQDTMFALQLIDEEWVFRSRLPGAHASRNKCSSLAVLDADAGATWIAQNMDLGAYTDGLQLLVRHAADERGPAQLVFTLAGHLGLMGVNEAGLGLCCNSLPQLPSASRGLPVAFAVRRVLEARTADEGARIVRAIPHATNQHYLLADPDRIVSLEASAAGVTEYRAPDPERVFHTNHPLSGAEEVNASSPAHRENTVARLASLTRRLATGPVDESVFRAALSSFDDPAHPVCRLRSDVPGLINFTTGSMITRLARTPPRVRTEVSFGPPSENDYHPFGFAA